MLGEEEIASHHVVEPSEPTPERLNPRLAISLAAKEAPEHRDLPNRRPEVRRRHWQHDRRTVPSREQPPAKFVEYLRAGRLGIGSGLVSEPQELPGNLTVDSQSPPEPLRRLELQSFDLAAALEHVVISLDQPAKPIVADSGQGLLGSLDRETGQEQPTQGLDSSGDVDLGDEHHSHSDRLELLGSEMLNLGVLLPPLGDHLDWPCRWSEDYRGPPNLELGPSGLALVGPSQLDRGASRDWGLFDRCQEVSLVADQVAVVSGSDQPVADQLVGQREELVDVGLAIGHGQHSSGWAESLLGLLQGQQPASTLLGLDRQHLPLVAFALHLWIASPSLLAKDAERNPAHGIDRQRGVNEQALVLRMLQGAETFSIGMGRVVEAGGV